MPQQVKTDKTLFATTVALVFFGLVMVYSASSVMAMQDPRYHSSTYFVVRHAIYLAPALGLIATVLGIAAVVAWLASGPGPVSTRSPPPVPSVSRPPVPPSAVLRPK